MNVSTASSSLIEELRSRLAELGPAVSAESTISNEIELSIVIPAFNEEARLPRTVLETLQWCAAERLVFEVIIADDGSQDNTLALARVLAECDPRVRVLACSHSGKGGAVRTGVLKAKGRWVLFMDADGATPITEIPKLLRLMQTQDIAIGSRAVKRAGDVDVKTSLHRRIVGRIFARIVNLLAVGGVEDTQCGFKMFRREAAMAVFGRQKTTGFAFDVEILLIARRLAFSIKEVPINWVAQPGSKVSVIRDSIRMLRDIVRIQWMHRDLVGMVFRDGKKCQAARASD
jgi:dolichyl-phosphate beta-glucosyltransferase